MHSEDEEKEKILREMKEFQKALEKDIEHMQQRTKQIQEIAKAMQRMRIIALSYVALVIVNVVLILVASTYEEWILFADLFTIAINAITVIFITILHEHNKRTLSHYKFSLKFLLFASIFVNIISAAFNTLSFFI